MDMLRDAALILAPFILPLVMLGLGHEISDPTWNDGGEE